MKKICGKKFVFYFSACLAIVWVFILGLVSVKKAEAAETLFYETPTIGGLINQGPGDGFDDFGFIFTTGATTTNITKVKLTTTNDSPIGNYAYVKIRKVSGCGNPLATSSETLISATNTEYSFTFPNGGITVESGAQYLLSYWSAAGWHQVEFRASTGSYGEDSYWWPACSLRLTGNHAYTKIYWDPQWTYVYCGDSVCSPGEYFSDCPQDCAPYYDQSNLFFFSNPYTRNNQSLARIRYLYNEAYFTPYDYIKIYEISTTNSASSTLIATSTVVDYNEIGGQKQGGQSYLTLTGSSTYIGNISYNIIAHFASYWDSSTGATTPARESIPWTLIVHWTNETNLPLPSWNFATSTVLGDDFNTHDMACTADEWSATTTLGINPHLCGIKQWLLDIGLKPTVYIISKINCLKDQIMLIFPFSLFKTIQDGWTNATNSLSYFLSIQPVYAGSYSTSTGIYTGTTSGTSGYVLELPNFLGATSSISLFSKSSITDLMGEEGYNLYYFIIRFLIWAAVAAYFWNLLAFRDNDNIL
jgi:hypothetical protein